MTLSFILSLLQGTLVTAFVARFLVRLDELRRGPVRIEVDHVLLGLAIVFAFGARP